MRRIVHPRRFADHQQRYCPEKPRAVAARTFFLLCALLVACGAQVGTAAPFCAVELSVTFSGSIPGTAVAELLDEGDNIVQTANRRRSGAAPRYPNVRYK